MNQFRYWRDPLFLICCALYGLNRWAVKPWTSSPFLHNHFSDLLLIPCALPPVLWIQRKLGTRNHDRPPGIGEITFHVVVWSVLFEAIGPHIMRVTGDIRDIAAYAAGAVGSGAWWKYFSRQSSESDRRL